MEEFSDTEYQYISSLLQMLKATIELHGVGNITLNNFINALETGSDIVWYPDEDEEEEDEDTPNSFRQIAE